MVDFDIDDAQRTTRTTLRYERIHMETAPSKPWNATGHAPGGPSPYSKRC